ncbi:hypothetical protein DPMN_182035 [Dreissena polymorpha]|uniref:SAM domain-containing protein n=1 Tax=Dreissena polymorpha TaxID=45954 RepID=A0A9D4DGD8_DREPO|nr:hypothetical protein DPMN_182035 [Dreissena polymorpha]
MHVFQQTQQVNDSSSGYIIIPRGTRLLLQFISYTCFDSSSGYIIIPRGTRLLLQFIACHLASSGLNQFGAVENGKHWLKGIEMERFAEIFTERGINGAQLATLDANNFKFEHLQGVLTSGIILHTG